jgi:hypothetical protein
MTVNGKTITVPNGRNVSVVNGVVTVDGVRYGDEGFARDVMEIRVSEGTVFGLNTDRSVTCKDVTGNITAGGSVSCDSVGHSVYAGGSVSCGRVGGDVEAGGSISCSR